MHFGSFRSINLVSIVVSWTSIRSYERIPKTVLRQSCDSLATVLRQSCDSLATVLRQSCDSPATVLRQSFVSNKRNSYNMWCTCCKYCIKALMYESCSYNSFLLWPVSTGTRAALTSYRGIPNYTSPSAAEFLQSVPLQILTRIRHWSDSKLLCFVNLAVLHTF